MPITAKLEDRPREVPATELTQAVCAFVVDCGQHKETNQAGVTSVKPKVMFIFELDQKRSDGQPFLMAEKFTNSLHKKANLRKFLEKLDGAVMEDSAAATGVDLEGYVRRNCYITPVHRQYQGKTYANIGSISKVRKTDTLIVPSVRELPQWVSDYIAKAEIPPGGEASASVAEGALPF